MKEHERKKLAAALEGIGVQPHLRNHIILEIQSETSSVETVKKLGLHYREFMQETIRAKMASDYMLSTGNLEAEEAMDYKAAIDALRKVEGKK